MKSYLDDISLILGWHKDCSKQGSITLYRSSLCYAIGLSYKAASGFLLFDSGDALPKVFAFRKISSAYLL